MRMHAWEPQANLPATARGGCLERPPQIERAPPPFRIEPLCDESQLEGARSAATWIIGQGQTIYWRSCFTCVYDASDPEEPLERHASCDGRAVLSPGIEVFVGGEYGRVEEGDVRGRAGGLAWSGGGKLGNRTHVTVQARAESAYAYHKGGAF